MAEERGRIIERRKLENGIELILYDRSRIMSGDRWLVELVCEAHVPVEDNSWNLVAGEEPHMAAEIRKILGERLVFLTDKKRNFVDSEEREKILQAMVQQVYSSILKYLQRPNFPHRLFMKQFRDARQKVMLQKAMQRLADD
jgi:DNA topoisomerase VI subunit B